MRLRVFTLSAVVTALLLPLAGCDADLSVGGEDPDTQTIEVRGARTGFTAEVPVDWGITDVRDVDACGSVSYRIRGAGSLRLVVTAVPSSCAEAGRSSEIGNGFHGIYRTIDDVPDPRERVPSLGWFRDRR